MRRCRRTAQGAIHHSRTARPSRNQRGLRVLRVFRALTQSDGGIPLASVLTPFRARRSRRTEANKTAYWGAIVRTPGSRRAFLCGVPVRSAAQCRPDDNVELRLARTRPVLGLQQFLPTYGQLTCHGPPSERQVAACTQTCRRDFGLAYYIWYQYSCALARPRPARENLAMKQDGRPCSINRSE